MMILEQDKINNNNRNSHKYWGADRIVFSVISSMKDACGHFAEEASVIFYVVVVLSFLDVYSPRKRIRKELGYSMGTYLWL